MVTFVRAVARMAMLCVAFGAVAFPVESQEAAGNSISYTYDDLGRLTSVVYSDGIVHRYTYDAVGNRKTHVVEGALPALRLWNGDGVEASGSDHKNDGKIWFTIWRTGYSSVPVSVGYETYVCTGSGADEGACELATAATPGRYGGRSSFQLVADNPFYLRALVGEKGADMVEVPGQRREPTGGSSTGLGLEHRSGDGGGRLPLLFRAMA